MKISLAVLAIVFVITLCKVIIEGKEKAKKESELTAIVRQIDGTSVILELNDYYFSPEGRLCLRTNDGNVFVAKVNDVKIIDRRPE